MELENRFDGNATFVLGDYKNLMVLDVNKGAEILREETIKEPSLEIRTQEGGKIAISVETDKLIIKSVSSGVIQLSGTSECERTQ